MFRFPDLFSKFTVGFLHAMCTRRFEFNSNLWQSALTFLNMYTRSSHTQTKRNRYFHSNRNKALDTSIKIYMGLLKANTLCSASK